MEKRPTTMKDIAQMLGITVATVSRALKDYPDISAKTKKLVQDLAEKLNYRPNAMASNLRKQQSNILGVVVPNIVHPFFSSVIGGIVEVAEAAGYSTMLCQTNETYLREVRDVNMLISSRVDGLLISLSNQTQDVEHLKEVIEYGIPLVLFDKISDELAVSKVVVDDYEGAFQAVDHLLEQGYRRIALLRGPEAASNSRLRYLGYKNALQKHGLEPEPSLIRYCQTFRHEEGAELARDLMSLHQPPDAIFAVADSVAIGAMMELKRLGKLIPEEVGIVGFSDWHINQVVEPKMSSVSQPGAEMGQSAAQLLIQHIQDKQKGKELKVKDQTLKTKLYIRGSSQLR